jgi:hypothetical protein
MTGESAQTPEQWQGMEREIAELQRGLKECEEHLGIADSPNIELQLKMRGDDDAE